MRIDNYIDRMNDLDDDAPPLPFPHTSQIEDELRELRPQIGGVRYRILYQRSGNLFVLLHALVKNTGAVETVRRLQVAHGRNQAQAAAGGWFQCSVDRGVAKSSDFPLAILLQC